MGWEAFLPIIINQGIPAAMKLWQLIEAKGTPTQAQWDELLKASQSHANDVMAARLTAAGIALDSPQGKALLGLVS